MSAKTVEARVSISTNPATAHIGRYAVTLVDTTGGREMSMTTRIVADPAAFVAEATAKGLAAGVLVELVDNTGGH